MSKLTLEKEDGMNITETTEILTGAGFTVRRGFGGIEAIKKDSAGKGMVIMLEFAPRGKTGRSLKTARVITLPLFDGDKREIAQGALAREWKQTREISKLLHCRAVMLGLRADVAFFDGKKVA